jgi:hypothetical protein
MINCRYGLLKITCSGQSGWGECIMSINENHFDLLKWSAFLYKLKKMTIHEAHETITLHKSLWGKVKTELVEMALLDLTARIQKKKFNEVIGLGGDHNTVSKNIEFGTGFQLDLLKLLQESQAYFAVI